MRPPIGPSRNDPFRAVMRVYRRLRAVRKSAGVSWASWSVAGSPPTGRGRHLLQVKAPFHGAMTLPDVRIVVARPKAQWLR